MPPSRDKKPPALKLLMVQLRNVQTSLDDIWRFMEDYSTSTTATQVNVRLQRVDELWEKYGEILIDIQAHDDFEDEDHEFDKARVIYSDRYYHSKAFLIDRAKELQDPEEVEQSIRANETAIHGHGTLDHVRLPQITLQIFHGDIDEWISFRDLFTSLIHRKTDLADVEKFHYLKGCLQGEPKNLIDSLKITKANYQIAWDMLIKRYDNCKQLKKRQIQALFSLPALSKESATDLHTLIDGFERVVQNLDQVVKPEEYKDLLLVNLLTSRLDPVTRRGWEEHSSTKEQDSFEDLSEFLHRRIRVLESLPIRAADSRLSNHVQHPSKQKSSVVKASYGSIQSSGGRCVICQQGHPLYQCSSFHKMSVRERDSILMSHSLCRNCFRSGHLAKACPSKYSCRSCKGRHHSLVCFKPAKPASKRVATVAENNDNSSRTDSAGTSTPTASQVTNMVATESTFAGTTQQFSSKVLLATAVVIVEDDEGSQFSARALLDSGSESNFITERLSQRLRTHRERVDVSVLGIGDAATKVRYQITAMVRSRVKDYSKTMNFLVLPRVTVDLPTARVNTTGWAVPEGINLADPSFFHPSSIDMVLGIEFFFDFFESGQRISLGHQLPTLNESVFGWIICGGPTKPAQGLCINCNVRTTRGLEELLARFWATEEIENSKALSTEERKCEEIFQRSVHREPDGRYCVALPKDSDAISSLGKSRDIAFRRLQGTERRLAKDVNLREQYHEFMKEYIDLGHMTKVEEKVDCVERCFLPHHPVIKESSTTTKVRVVFDASCKTSSGISLNDALLAGPIVQEDLRAIMLRSRMRQVMLVADIEKMFRQILIVKEDRPLQSILWRFNAADYAGVYELKTVTYGTKSAPFLATRSLNQLAIDEQAQHPMASKAIIEDTYMDDVITGADTVQNARELCDQLTEMTSKGGFKLRKWASNNPTVLEGISQENLAIQGEEGINLDPNPTVKTLGLTWMPFTDQLKFQFSIPPWNSAQQPTKREVLSIIASLFDPLGLIGPTITAAKIIMQLLWRIRNENDQTLDWDALLPSTVGEKWKRFYDELPLINSIRIDRCVVIPEAKLVEIHCFSDASNKAYGGCIYIRSIDLEGRVMVRLLTSKSKVAPLKTLSIPRLELCGALLVTKLYEKVRDAINISVQSYFWTDSTCILRWIQGPSNVWTTFIANRVAKIQGITRSSQWRHVSGKENPADLISRGVYPAEIIKNYFWWEGPNWLKEDSNTWPTFSNNWSNNEMDNIADEERRKGIICTTSVREEFNNWYLQKFESYMDLIRKTAIWLRYLELLRNRLPRAAFRKTISTLELRTAENLIIRRVQQEVFEDEWKSLSKGETVSRKSALRWFNPYISEDQVIKVGGRLGHSAEREDSKHPIVLPSRHKLTRLILKYYHLQLLHAGPQLLLSVVRLRFWPLGGRNLARHVVHQCLKCFRAKPSLIEQFMGELPAPRVTVSRPFSQTGVDYFGPFYVRPAPRRPAIKAYVAVFICLCTKAVHLELVSDLSTDRFLQALLRFVARRGKCRDIYSDNGTNFVGARNKMQEFLNLLRNSEHQEKVTKECADVGIQWHFNPPSAPHFGGLWEAAVRSAKNHLIKIVGETPLSPEDFNTLLVQVEGCLNSRPITQMSDDPSDLEPLTPSHFLIGSSLQSLPEPNYENIRMNRLNQYQLIQRIMQDFWRRWRREYLCQLQGRTKRWKPPIKVDVGKLVIVQDENLPPMKWKMARIAELHPGEDGVVRVVTLKTANGLLKRAVERLCFLPIPNDDQIQS